MEMAVQHGLEPVFDPREAANYLACSRSLVYELIKSGELRAVRVGPKLLRVPESALRDFVAAR